MIIKAALSLIFIIFASSFASAADWAEIARSYTGDIWYIDLSGIKEKGRNYRFQVKVLRPDGISAGIEYSLNCSSKTHKPVTENITIDFGKYSGTLRYKDIYPYFMVKNGAVMEEIYYMLCEKYEIYHRSTVVN